MKSSISRRAPRGVLGAIYPSLIKARPDSLEKADASFFMLQNSQTIRFKELSSVIPIQPAFVLHLSRITSASSQRA
jgi:hypothetical protein